MRLKHILVCALLGSLFLSVGCANKDDRGINLFSIDDDKELGLSLVAHIDSNTAEYPVLSETLYPAAYTYIRGLRDSILNSGEVFYATEFDWDVYIIEDDSTLNAFCAPGGYIYVYTGLIKYLDTEDQLIGVLGHEMAHADRRHSTDQLTKAYGLAFMFDLLLGNNQGALTDIAQSLVGLSFSRADEKEADEYSVVYLCPTSYNAAGAAGFFEKISAQGGSSTPAFLSTHPNPDNRVEEIYFQKDSVLICAGAATYDVRYQDFITNDLP